MNEIHGLNVYDTTETYGAILRGLEEPRMAFLRFGHSEMDVMDGRRGGREQDGSEALRGRLEDAFSCTDYIRSVPVGIKEPWMPKGPFSTDLYSRIALERDPGPLYNFDALIMLAISLPDELLRLLGLLRGATVVGGRHLRPAAGIFRGEFMETPTKNAFSDIKRLEEEVLSCPTTMVFGCGPTANVLQKTLWDSGKEVKTIDFGSTLDLVAGNLPNRSWVLRATDFRNMIRKKL